ncbi:MAG: glycosyltransferase [Actinobacteria bacterium]|nr:glycosyltransferase [Actinomycetota bacterium]
MRQNVGHFDVVEIHGLFSFVPLYVAWACARAGVPFVVRPHGSLDPFDLRKHAVAKKLYGRLVVRPMLRRASCVILTSPLEAERIVTFGAEPVQLVQPLPVREADEVGDGEAFRRSHGIPGEAVVVLFLGRIDRKKGLEVLIPSLAHLKPDIPHLWLVIAGDGPDGYVEEVRSLVSIHGMDPWTTWSGFVSGSEKAGAFAASDLFALCSKNENFGIVLVEAMRAGLPLVISKEVYMHQELVEGGAAIASGTNVVECSSALGTLLRDPRQRRTASANARALAEAMFSVSDATKPLLRLYERLAGPASTVDGVRVVPAGSSLVGAMGSGHKRRWGRVREK